MPTSQPRRPRPALSLFLVTLLAGTALAALVSTRPEVGPRTWARGDELALFVAWVVAVAASAWLFIGTGICALALRCSRPHLARRLAPILPVGIRRLVEIAIVGSCIVLPALPAYATTPPTVATVVLADQPVVRAPAITAPVAAPFVSPPITRHAAAPVPLPAPGPTPPPTSGHVVVRPGDNLWLIARASLTQPTSRRPTDAEIARYWRAVIAANRSTLRSRDPSLIFPGEIVTLPPASAVS